MVRSCRSRSPAAGSVPAMDESTILTSGWPGRPANMIMLSLPLCSNGSRTIALLMQKPFSGGISSGFKGRTCRSVLSRRGPTSRERRFALAVTLKFCIRTIPVTLASSSSTNRLPSIVSPRCRSYTTTFPRASCTAKTLLASKRRGASSWPMAVTCDSSSLSLASNSSSVSLSELSISKPPTKPDWMFTCASTGKSTRKRPTHTVFILSVIFATFCLS